MGNQEEKSGEESKGSQDIEVKDLEEEGTKMRGNRKLNEPTREEVEAHNLTHIPFRSWCPHCVRGRGKNPKHEKGKEEEQSIPVISMDYMWMKEKGEESGESPIMAMYCRQPKWRAAIPLRNKGRQPHSIKRIAEEIRKLG